MSNLDQCIIEKAKIVWDAEYIKGVKNKNNCSGFVKAVAKELGIPLPEPANANEIADSVKNDWKKVRSGTEAAQLAGTGIFVLAVLKGSEHAPARINGHVAIVVSGKLYKNKYPAVWGGSIGGAQSQGEKTVGEVWNNTDRDSVEYYAYGISACK